MCRREQLCYTTFILPPPKHCSSCDLLLFDLTKQPWKHAWNQDLTPIRSWCEMWFHWLLYRCVRLLCLLNLLTGIAAGVIPSRDVQCTCLVFKYDLTRMSVLKHNYQIKKHLLTSEPLPCRNCNYRLRHSPIRCHEAVTPWLKVDMCLVVIVSTLSAVFRAPLRNRSLWETLCLSSSLGSVSPKRPPTTWSRNTWSSTFPLSKSIAGTWFFLRA